MAQDETLVSGVAGRYASALFSLAQDDRQTDAVAQSLSELDALIAGSPDLRGYPGPGIRRCRSWSTSGDGCMRLTAGRFSVIGPEKKIDIRPVSLSRSRFPDCSQPNDVPARLALEERRPSVHQRAPAIERVAAPICPLRRVADDAKSMGLAGWRQFVRVDEGAGSASAFRKPPYWRAPGSETGIAAAGRKSQSLWAGSLCTPGVQVSDMSRETENGVIFAWWSGGDSN